MPPHKAIRPLPLQPMTPPIRVNAEKRLAAISKVVRFAEFLEIVEVEQHEP